MCGIIGYKGKQSGTKTILDGLKRLEYRGYDSWGIAGYSNKKIWICRQTGEVDENIEAKQSNTIIGHTRWATHGKATQKNAHPHISNDGTIAVVHNGILDNYAKLKQELAEYEFQSETDTEAIPNLIQHYMKTHPFPTAFKKAIDRLKGSYAIAALCGNEVAFARHESPLLLGLGHEELYIASDSSPFIGKTNKVIFLEDGEWGYSNHELHIYKGDKEIKKDVQELKHEKESRTLDKYPHYMLKEIYEQPKTLDVERDLEQAKQIISESKEIFILGCGTSYHAGLAATNYFRKQGKRATAVLASEYQTKLPFMKKQDCLIIISQSGETADLREAVIKAKQKEPKVIAIINVPGSTLWRISDCRIAMRAGMEIGVASTKAYTAALQILKDLTNKNPRNLSKICRNSLDYWREKAEYLKSEIKKDLFIIGRDEAHAYALEGALKVKEISYIRAEALAGGELKHGTLALIEKGTPVIAVATPETRQELINNALEIKARGGRIIGIDSQKSDCYDHFIKCEDPMLSVIPMQLLAYELSVSKGYNPDKPRNLAKSVTVK